MNTVTMYQPGPLHPDLFGGATPLPVPVEVPAVQRYEYGVSWSRIEIDYDTEDGCLVPMLHKGKQIVELIRVVALDEDDALTRLEEEIERLKFDRHWTWRSHDCSSELLSQRPATLAEALAYIPDDGESC